MQYKEKQMKKIIKFTVGLITVVGMLYSCNAQAQDGGFNPEYFKTYETPDYIRESPEWRR